MDAGARAAEYGAMSWGPMWVMDGTIANKYYTEVFDYEYYSSFDKRALMDPAWEISDVTTELDGGSVKISSTISKISTHIDERLGTHDVKVRYAITQNDYTDDEGEIHKNVMIELLPNGTGNVVKTLREDEFAVGDSVTLTDYWTPSVPTNGQEFKLIIYVQGRLNYDEVEQVWFDTIPTEHIPALTGVSGIQLTETSYSIYPNPASDVLNLVNTSETMREEVAWSIFNVSGQSVKQGVLYSSDDTQQIDVNDLMQGMYVLRLTLPDGTSQSKRFSRLGTE